MLSRDQAQPCRHLSPVLETLCVSHGCCQRTGGNRPDAGNLCQLAAGFVFPMPSLDLSFKFIDLLVQFLEVIDQASDEQPEAAWQLKAAILNERWHIPGDMHDPPGNRDTVLCQQPANLVRLRRSCLHESLPGTVYAQNRLLLDILDGHETHVFPPD